MYSLLGPNVAVMHQVPELVARWKPPVCVVMDHGDAWGWCAEQTSNTVFIGRQFREKEFDFNEKGLDPVAAARAYCAGLLPLAASYREVFSYWQGCNEPAIHSAEAMRRYARFEAERVRILAAEGIRAAVGTFAVGNPSDLSWWADFLPALAVARHHGGVLALHEYDWPEMLNQDPNRHTDWLGLRHRKVYRGEPGHNWPGLLALGYTIPLVITETGVDRLIEGKRGGFRRRWAEDEYLQQLQAYNAELTRDPYVVGAAIFCCGQHGDWWTYDIYPQPAGQLAETATPEYRHWLVQDHGRIFNLVDGLPRTGEYPARSVEEVERVVVHHSAVHPKAEDAAYIREHIRAIARGHLRRGWPGIAHHYCIGPWGDTYRVNALERAAYHAGRYNRTSIGVCLLGALHRYDPPAAQLAALRSLLQMLDLPVVGHKELTRTQCPGRWWDRFKV